MVQSNGKQPDSTQSDSPSPDTNHPYPWLDRLHQIVIRFYEATSLPQQVGLAGGVFLTLVLVFSPNPVIVAVVITYLGVCLGWSADLYELAQQDLQRNTQELERTISFQAETADLLADYMTGCTAQIETQLAQARAAHCQAQQTQTVAQAHEHLTQAHQYLGQVQTAIQRINHWMPRLQKLSEVEYPLSDGQPDPINQRYQKIHSEMEARLAQWARACQEDSQKIERSLAQATSP